MNRKKKVILALPILALILFLGYSAVMGISFSTEEPVLDFPIEEDEHITRLSAYHTPDWGEEGVFHNGIDLVISADVTILAPVDGTITEYSEHVNPYGGNVLFNIQITINLAWQVKLVLEPGFRDDSNNSLQSDNIDVSVGQQVQAGDSLATLLYSENYPHLHYMLLYQGSDVCAYNYSSAAAKSTFEGIASDSGTRILYPHEGPTVSLSPMVLAIVGIAAVYLVIAVIVFKRD